MVSPFLSGFPALITDSLPSESSAVDLPPSQASPSLRILVLLQLQPLSILHSTTPSFPKQFFLRTSFLYKLDFVWHTNDLRLLQEVSLAFPRKVLLHSVTLLHLLTAHSYDGFDCVFIQVCFQSHTAQ